MMDYAPSACFKSLQDRKDIIGCSTAKNSFDMNLQYENLWNTVMVLHVTLSVVQRCWRFSFKEKPQWPDHCFDFNTKLANIHYIANYDQNPLPYIFVKTGLHTRSSRRMLEERSGLSPKPWALCVFWVPNVTITNQVSEWGKLLGHQALRDAGLRACTGTAGDTGSRTWWNRQARDQSHLPVWTIVIIMVTGAVLMADHHPGSGWAAELLSVWLNPRDVAGLGPHVSRVAGSQVDSFATECRQQVDSFCPVVPVLPLPLVEQDVEVSRTLKKAKVARRRWWWKDSLKLSEASQLVLALCQHTHILWS